MKTELMTSPDFVIRPLETMAEVETYHRLNAQVFRPDDDFETIYTRRLRATVESPDFSPRQFYSAFLGDTHVGGYIMRERVLCLGSARLLTGCIGGVATHPDYRHQGIASAMMRDAIARAEKRHYALLLLHGIGNFYSQFGYTDVLEDIPIHFIERSLIPEQPVAGYTVREATLDDAQALLQLYREHYGAYLGSFAPVRTLEQQQHFLRHWFEQIFPLLALNAQGRPEGYLLLFWRQNRLVSFEVATNTWPAALSLLQYHSHLLDGEPEPPDTLDWPVPPQSPTYYLLADALPIRSEIHTYPDGGWMARPGHLPTLFHALIPLWQERWLSNSLDSSGILEMKIGDFTTFLELQAGNLRAIERPDVSVDATHTIQLSPQGFLQLVFSFRPASWIAQQKKEHIPEELLTVMERLFPLSPAWIAGSDGF
jgi:predicted N-acetyltransferase YhbS